jgi:hypothetical protein
MEQICHNILRTRDTGLSFMGTKESLPVHSVCTAFSYIWNVRMKGIQNAQKKYISEINCHTRIRFMPSEGTLRQFFHTILGITWTERWLDYELAEVDQSLGPLGRQI